MITGFQFRAAKKALNVTAKEASSLIGVHEVTLARFNKTRNTDLICCHTKTIAAIITYFAEKGVWFKPDNSITLINTHKKNSLLKGLTRFQLICARLATGLSQAQIAKIIGVSSGTVSNLERLPNPYIISSRKIDAEFLKVVFERVGVEFIGEFSVRLNRDPAIFFKESKNVN